MHRSQLSTSTSPCLGDFFCLTTEEREGKLAAYLDQRRVRGEFHPFHPSLFLPPNIVLVSHFIIGRPFPNDGHGLAAVAWALAPTCTSTSHLLDHYPRSLGIKAVITLRMPCLWKTRPSLFHDLHTSIVSFNCPFLDHHADSVTLRFTIKSLSSMRKNLNFPSPKSPPRESSQSTTPHTESGCLAACQSAGTLS